MTWQEGWTSTCFRGRETVKISSPGTSAETPEHRLLLEVVDSLGVALVFFSSDRVPLHATSRLAFLLAQEPDGPALLREVQLFAGELSGLMETRRFRGQHGVEPLSDRSVVGCCGMYRLQGSCLGAYLFGSPGMILVTVEAPSEDPLSPEVLRRRWQLSKRQAVVAQLLAKGRTNEEVSTALTISPHTARRHTEQIMTKLGARTRAEVASLLLRS